VLKNLRNSEKWDEPMEVKGDEILFGAGVDEYE